MNREKSANWGRHKVENAHSSDSARSSEIDATLLIYEAELERSGWPRNLRTRALVRGSIFRSIQDDEWSEWNGKKLRRLGRRLATEW